MAASAMSPASSPRLPSPPPIAEDQLGPKSPLPASEQQKSLGNIDHGASRRIRPGTKAEDMAEGPPLVDMSEIDSAFQLTEHLKALHNFLTHPIGTTNTVAVDRDVAQKLAQPPDNVDKTLWLYELCRFLTQKVNIIIVALFSDNPPCSSQTCPEMRASEWQYLCAVHDPPKSCCAIDYCCHTLDWAANTLTSPKTFPSRLALGNDTTTQHQQIRNLTNIFRRVYRIFAHAWFQHRDVFWRVEGRTGLYILFKTVCDAYGLIPEDNYTIPPEAEGETDEPAAEKLPPPKILKREPSAPGPENMGSSSIIDGMSEHSLSTAGTTKRHRHSPLVGATSVTTVVEESEEEDSPGGAKPTSLEAHFSISDPAPDPAPAPVPTPHASEPERGSSEEASPESAQGAAHEATEQHVDDEAAPARSGDASQGTETETERASEAGEERGAVDEAPVDALDVAAEVPDKEARDAAAEAEAEAKAEAASAEKEASGPVPTDAPGPEEGGIAPAPAAVETETQTEGDAGKPGPGPGSEGKE